MIRPLNLASRAVGAGLWTVGTRLISKVIDLTLLLCLARFLGPAEFGVVAAAMAVVFIVEAIFEMPTTAALIRVTALTDQMLHTAFTISLLRGITIAILLMVVSRPLADFSGETRLMYLLPALAVAPAARGLVSPRMVEYVRNYNFKPDAILELSGKSIAFIIAVSIAFVTKSYWAIAAATICGPLASTTISYVLAPIKPKITLSQWKLFSNLIGWNFVSQFCSALNWQIDRLLLPRLTTNSEFGRYAMVKQISEIPIQALIQPLARPAMAALASADDMRNSRYLQLSHGIMLAMLPLVGVLAFWPQVVIQITLGSIWLPAAKWLSWLSIICMLDLPALLMSSLAMTLDRTRWVAIRTFLELALRLPLVSTGAAFFGVAGAISGNAIATVATSFVGLLIVQRIAKISIYTQLKNSATPFLAFLPCGTLLYLTQETVMNVNSVSKFVGSIALVVSGCLIFYTLFLYIGWRVSGRPPGVESHVYKILKSFLATQYTTFQLRKMR